LVKRKRKRGEVESPEVLLKRAEELAQQAQDGNRKKMPALLVLLFNLGKETLAIDTKSVKEILNPYSLKWVPFTPRFIAGVVNLRGDIITVFDMASLLQKDNHNFGKESEIIILKSDHFICGILVDSSEEIIEVNEEEILEPIPTDNRLTHFLSATIKKQNNLYQTIDINKILHWDDVKALWDSSADQAVTTVEVMQ